MTASRTRHRDRAVAFNVARATSNAIYEVRDDADRMEIAADRVSSSVAHRDSPSDPHHAIVSAVTVDSDLNKIEAALDAASEALRPFVAGSVEASFERGDDPLTEADLAVDEAVKGVLSSPEDGWLSEETADSAARLGCRRTWVVDPLDGTREFVKGIPEWCVSVGLVEDGVPVAGGILAPAAGLRIVGAMDRGVTLNGVATGARKATSIQGALVLASRSEVKRGLWSPFFATDISIRSMGSVALKLALVAVGLADATWTLVPKNEWDVAAGAALVLASGGRVSLPDGTTRSFNSPDPLLPGFIATVHGLFEPIHDLVVHTIASQNDV